MKQICQKLKDGVMRVHDVPIPAVWKGSILVKNHYSLISAGTEGSTVKTARKGFIGKAKERPQQAKQAIEVLQQQGAVQTYRAVMKKLDAYSSLGYSCAGEVIDIAESINEFTIGDRVACGGLTACHSEIVSVPVNICVKLHPDANLKLAAYNTLGAIAMQGVRQAGLRLGETCTVIGLGLLGQLTGLLLKASGVRVIGVDINKYMVDSAKYRSADYALLRNNSGVEKQIIEITDGLGCDAVIITAATDSLDPINFAGGISRKRGTVVVVGDVPTGFDREPHYYKKELQVKMSCSYGPGRYDPQYEEKGIDYPPAYVRWTEKRNMLAFQDLLYTGKINVDYLTTHTFKLEDAPAAYDMMLAKSEPFLGILIEYDAKKKKNNDKIVVNIPKIKKRNFLNDPNVPKELVSIGFIGAGSYAQSHLLPNIPKKRNDIKLKGVLTASGTTSRSVAERFGFEFCTGKEQDIIGNLNINTVFIATRHNTHAEYVIKSLKAGKNVFVEKPLCLTEAELFQIYELVNSENRETENKDDNLINNRIKDKKGTENTNQPIHNFFNPPLLLVGYNRRFAPLAIRLKKQLGDGPKAMTYRINAGAIPSDSWIQDREIGGGRIIGEVCHFVDFLSFIADSPPVSVVATSMKDSQGLNDTLSTVIKFANGSIGTTNYFSNGDKRLPKEKLEVFSNGCSAILDDFRELIIYANGKIKKKKLISQNKGQDEEVKLFLDAVAKGGPSPIPLDEIFTTSQITFGIEESIRTGKPISFTDLR